MFWMTRCVMSVMVCNVEGDWLPTSVETFTVSATTANIAGPVCILHLVPRPTGALSRKTAIVRGQLTSTLAIRPVCPDWFVPKRVAFVEGL